MAFYTIQVDGVKPSSPLFGVAYGNRDRLNGTLNCTDVVPRLGDSESLNIRLLSAALS